jgi:hypothetical protein
LSKTAKFDEMQTQYDFSYGVRGKHHRAYHEAKKNLKKGCGKERL